jgi:hypothetical protein
MSRLALLASVSVLLLVGGAAAQTSPLEGRVGPGASIALTDASGNVIRNAEPGTYEVHVSDRSAEHNFHLAGPGVDQATGVAEAEDVTWTVTLQEGRYTFVCDVHPVSLRGDFTAGAVAPSAPMSPPSLPPSPPAPPPPAANALRLRGSVGPGAVISLTTTSGARVRVLVPGRYSILVADRSSRDNFHLIGPGLNRKTGIAARTGVTWTVTLRVGTFSYRSDAHPTLQRTFVVRSAKHPT